MAATATLVRSSPDQGRLMLAVADRHRARFARTFIASARRIRSRLTADVAADALSEPIGAGRLWNLIDEAPIVKDAASEAIAAYAEIASQAAHSTLAMYHIPGIGARGGKTSSITELAARLDVKSPFMQRAAQELSANLVTQVNGETKRAIRQVILDAHRSGIGPFEASKQIEQIVGLTSKQAAAVRNYRAGLADVRDKVRSRGGLRDRWSLSPKVGRLSLNPEQIDRLSQRYADRLLEYRAYNIARTETLFAANMGQQITFREMARTGIIDAATFRRVWSVVDDDRLCELCAPMDGQTVSLDQDFTSSEKGVLPSERTPLDTPQTTEVPPLHASCRCIIVTEQAEPAEQEAGPAPEYVPEEPAPATDPFGQQLGGFLDVAQVMAQLEAADAGSVQALAFDGGSLERLELRLAQVDADPASRFLSNEVQFKLTEEAKARLLEEIRAEIAAGGVSSGPLPAEQAAWNEWLAAHPDDFKGAGAAAKEARAAALADQWTDLGKLSIPKRIDGVMAFEDPAFTTSGGRTYELQQADGTRIRVHASDRGSRDGFSFDGMVQAWLPSIPGGPSDSELLAGLMRRVGVTDVAYPSQEAAAAYARAQAGALFRTSAGQSAADALAGAQRVFGLNPADLYLSPGLNGQIEVRLPEAVANEIMAKTGVRSFVHTITSRNSKAETVQMLADMMQGGMKSTTTRWTEGLGGRGQSSARDVGTGGADYVFTRQVSPDGLERMTRSSYEPAFVFRGDQLLQRTDWFAYTSDNYGAQNIADPSYKSAIGARDNLRNLGSNGYGSQETMFRGRIDMSHLDRLIIRDDAMRQNVKAELERRGITTIGGRPLYQVIVKV